MFVEETLKQKLKWRSIVTTLIQSQEKCTNAEYQNVKRRVGLKMPQTFIIINFTLKNKEKSLKENFKTFD